MERERGRIYRYTATYDRARIDEILPRATQRRQGRRPKEPDRLSLTSFFNVVPACYRYPRVTLVKVDDPTPPRRRILLSAAERRRMCNAACCE